MWKITNWLTPFRFPGDSMDGSFLEALVAADKCVLGLTHSDGPIPPADWTEWLVACGLSVGPLPGLPNNPDCILSEVVGCVSLATDIPLFAYICEVAGLRARQRDVRIPGLMSSVSLALSAVARVALNDLGLDLAAGTAGYTGHYTCHNLLYEMHL